MTVASQKHIKIDDSGLVFGEYQDEGGGPEIGTKSGN